MYTFDTKGKYQLRLKEQDKSCWDLLIKIEVFNWKKNNLTRNGPILLYTLVQEVIRSNIDHENIGMLSWNVTSTAIYDWRTLFTVLITNDWDSLHKRGDCFAIVTHRTVYLPKTDTLVVFCFPWTCFVFLEHWNLTFYSRALILKVLSTYLTLKERLFKNYGEIKEGLNAGEDGSSCRRSVEISLLCRLSVNLSYFFVASRYFFPRFVSSHW